MFQVPIVVNLLWPHPVFSAVPLRDSLLFPLVVSSDSALLIISQLAGQAVLHSGSLEISLSQFLQFTKESSASWRARAFEFVSGLVGSTIMKVLTILVLNMPPCEK